MITVCSLRDAGIFNNSLMFKDDYFNSYSKRERMIIINCLRTSLVRYTPEKYLVSYTATAIFPYGPTAMLIRDNLRKLTQLKEEDDRKKHEGSVT